jgi:hypothetical protein
VRDGDVSPDETVAGVSAGAGGAETEIVPPVTQAQPEHAWSKEEPQTEPLRQPWGRAWSAAAVFVMVGVVVAIAIAGWALLRSHTGPNQPTPAASPASAPPSSTSTAPSSEPVLDGTYRFVFDLSRETFNVKGSAADTGTRTSWWALRSQCQAGRCMAAGVRLDDTYHTVQSSRSDVIRDAALSWTDGQWIELPITSPLPSSMAPCTTASTHIEMRMQPDNTLAGVETKSIGGGCPESGTALMTPFVATRMGPVPDGIFGRPRAN